LVNGDDLAKNVKLIVLATLWFGKFMTFYRKSNNHNLKV